MFKKSISFALIGIAVTGIVACSNNKFKKTKDGLEYRIVKDEKGSQNPKMGDVVKMHIHIHVGDSVLFDSRKMNNNEPIEFPLMPSDLKGDWIDGVSLMTPGDSAIFRVPADSMKKRMQGSLPPFIKEGDKIEYNVVLVSSRTQEQVKKENDEKASKQIATDDQILQDYFAKNNITPQKTASGLYYIIEKEGTGNTIQQGQTAVVNYTGKTLDGNTFDSNTDPQFQHVEPLKVVVGTGSVIPGWDEGLQLLKKGSVAKFYIPSPLAYGAQSPGPGIEPNAILMFDVTVTDVK